MRIANWLLGNSLWLAAFGLMLASSGIDGAYMASMMESNLWPLGYVMNTMSDVSGLAIMYWFGRLQQEHRGSKKWRLSRVLLGGEVVAVCYSWFFSWRQLIRTLQQVEYQDTIWVAPIAAGFIPLLLAFIGWAQALRAGRFDDQQVDMGLQQAVVAEEQQVVTELLQCPICGATTSKSGEAWKNQRALDTHIGWCKRRKTDF